MQIMLDAIADLLRQRGLTIEVGSTSGEDFWYVSDVPEQTVIRVMIFPDYNGYPSFWTESFASYAEQYVIPIITRIGDARDEVIDEHLMASRQRQLPI